jgi:hypothetical protein
MKAKTHRGKSRTTARLSVKLDKTLVAYANAASAAGVGILALSCPAAAEIVYTHVHQKLPFNKTFYLDLNHDGIADFGFNNTRWSDGDGSGSDFLTIFPAKSANRIWGDKTASIFYRSASALAAGVRVEHNREFTPGNKLMAHWTTSSGGLKRASSRACKGPWKNVTDRYLGLKFIIKGETHYGWARLNVTCSDVTVTATLTGYAYETVANQEITTGNTNGADDGRSTSATLGRLAQGSTGSARRRTGATALAEKETTTETSGGVYE